MIYLDNAASTPLAPELFEQLLDVYQHVGNAQSLQQLNLKTVVKKAASQIAEIIHAPTNCIHFTSGATESINTALLGGCEYYKESGNHIITFETEHQATLHCVHALKDKGFEVSILPVKPSGAIDVELLKKHIQPHTIMISVNHVCNETGYIQDLTPLAMLRSQYGFLLHVDACQSIGKAPLNLNKTPCDFISLSAHKAHGPQGVGALYIAPNRHVTPMIHGSHPIRSGTPPHALISLMGKAYELSKQTTNIEDLAQLFLDHLQVKYERNVIGVPHILNLYFPNMSTVQFTEIQKHIYCQQSSACHNNSYSHVLLARGFNKKRIEKSIRFSISRYTTSSDLIQAAKIINRILSDT